MWRLAETLSDLRQVVVVALDRNQSGVGAFTDLVMRDSLSGTPWPTSWCVALKRAWSWLGRWPRSSGTPQLGCRRVSAAEWEPSGIYLSDASCVVGAPTFCVAGNWLVYRDGGIDLGGRGGGGPGKPPFLTMSGISLGPSCGLAILVIIVMALPNEVVYGCGIPASMITFIVAGSRLVYCCGGLGGRGEDGPGKPPFLTMSGISLGPSCGLAILVIIVMALPNDVVYRCSLPASIITAVK